MKCKVITRGVLAAELYVLTHGFDIAASIKATLEGIYGHQVPLVLCTDSKSIFDSITSLGTTQEKAHDRHTVGTSGIQQT